MEFSLCLLFAKLVSYTFLYWLPLYISNVGETSHTLSLRPAPETFLTLLIASLIVAAHFDARQAGDLSTLFDVGGIVGKHRAVFV